MFMAIDLSHQDGLFEFLKINRTALIFVTSLENFVQALTVDLVNNVVGEKGLKFTSFDQAVAILVEKFEHFLEVIHLEKLLFFKGRSQKFSIIDFAILVNINRVHQLFEFLHLEPVSFLRKGSFQLINADKTVVIGVNFSKDFAQLLNILLRHLGCDIGSC